MEKILIDREIRSNQIKELLEKTNNPIISIKANVVGSNKSPYYAYLIVKRFFGLIKKEIKIQNFFYYDSYDGPYYLIESIDDANYIKEKAIALEDNDILGRLVDIDVYTLNGSINRNTLNKQQRRCLVCENYAHVCVRSKKHSLYEVEEKVNEIIRNYLKTVIYNKANEAITLEAKLDPKFGLVTSKSNGSHQDMDYNLLMKAKEVILPDLVEMFFCGFDNDLLEGFYLAREIGLKTEEKMFQVTNNVNTYKGLIFILGITIIALGYAIKHHKKDLFSLIEIIGRDLHKEFDENIDTFGKLAYKEYKISGARGEVSKGLINVKKAKSLLDSLDDSNLTMTLIYLIRNVDDTVLLKRAKSLEKYNYYRELVGNINQYDIKLINEVTDECIKNNISFGGSADLLVASIFLKLIERELVIEYE